MDYNIFIKEWVKRSERKEGEDFIDIGDKFISLWIAFNAWLKSQFGENKYDCDLKNDLISFSPMEDVFNEFKNNNKELDRLRNYKVKNMKFPEDESKKKSYNGSFSLLIEVLYEIRCNLFHGRKDLNSDDQIDKELVELAYKILSPLFKKYLEIYNFNLL
ncbi:MAG: hypothetical protein KJ571_19815 [Bacteroidetes bacterium]|nr:hypothetical protein [Bacteroidota bacterium]